ncbi:MAG: RNA polymerase sigma factor [Chlorobi bacterium]|nr:RNA polymerase sigma factor [Chlorobiota bacterium]
MKKVDRKETEHLIRKIRKGDLRAFEKLASLHLNTSFRVAFRVLGNKNDAEDAVQDSWIKIWKNISAFREKADFSTWMYRIVTNTCMDYLKQRMHRLDYFTDQRVGLTMAPDHAQNPETLFVNNEQLNLLRRLSGSLPPKQKMIFILRDLEGLSPDEVAEVLEMDKDLVKSHLAHARKTLRIKAEKLQKEEERYYDMRKN